MCIRDSFETVYIRCFYIRHCRNQGLSVGLRYLRCEEGHRNPSSVGVPGYIYGSQKCWKFNVPSVPFDAFRQDTDSPFTRHILSYTTSAAVWGINSVGITPKFCHRFYANPTSNPEDKFLASDAARLFSADYRRE